MIKQVYSDTREKYQDELRIKLSILAEAIKELEQNNYKYTRLNITSQTHTHIPSVINLPTTQGFSHSEDSTFDHYAYQPNFNYNNKTQQSSYGMMNQSPTSHKPSSPPRKKQLLNQKREEESRPTRTKNKSPPKENLPRARQDTLESNTTHTKSNTSEEITTTDISPITITPPRQNIAKETEERNKELEERGLSNQISIDLAQALTSTDRKHTNTPTNNPLTSPQTQETTTQINIDTHKPLPEDDTTTKQVDDHQDEGKNTHDQTESPTASPQGEKETTHDTEHHPNNRKETKQITDPQTHIPKPKRGLIAKTTVPYWEERSQHPPQDELEHTYKPKEPETDNNEKEDNKSRPSITLTVRVNNEKNRRPLQATPPEHSPGTKVLKTLFKDEKTGKRRPFSGKIVEFNPVTGYRIQYEDSDTEDLGVLSTQTVLNNAKEQPKETFKPGTFRKRLFDFVSNISIWPKKKRRLEINDNGDHTSS